MSPERLERLLGRWAAGHGVEAGDARRLADRIAEELGRAPRPASESPDVAAAPRPFRARVVCAVLAVGAALLIVLLPLWLFRSPSQPGASTVAAPQIAVSQRQIEAHAQLFAEVWRLFGNDLRWVSETSGQVELGVGPVAGGAATGGPPLWIRVLVVRRQAGQSSWRTVLTTDVLTRNEEYVQTQRDPQRDHCLTLWGYVLPDGNVAVDSRIRLREPIRLSADVANVFTPGKPLQVFASTTDGGEIRVFHLVTVLPTGEDRSCSGA